MRKVNLNLRRRVRIPIRRPWIPTIILITSLVVTILATFFVTRSGYALDRLRFESAVDQTQSNIDNRIETYIALLRGASGLIAAQPAVTSQEFRAFVERLKLTERYPGVQGIGYAVRVSNADKDAFVAQQKAAGNDGFAIRPDGNRPEYYPIIYLEPSEYKTNQRAAGFDVLSESTRKNAVQRARDTGASAASGKVTLAQPPGEKKQAGFLIYTPVYTQGTTPSSIEQRRQEIQGFVYSPFRADDLLTDIAGPQSKAILDYQVYDGKNINSQTLIHNSKDTSKTDPKFVPHFTSNRSIQVAGETWTLTFESTPEFENQSQNALAPFIFSIGIVISGILFLLSRSQFTARTVAERTAAELLESQKELQKAIGMRDTFISVASHELRTPVTSLKVYGEVLQKQFQKDKQTTAAKAMARMNAQIDRLTVLIMDLLDVTRIQAGKLAFDEDVFDLAEIVSDIVQTTQPIADNHKIVLRSVPKLLVNGDKDRIGQVVSNFLTNAIKYSPDAKEVLVRVEKKQDTAVVSVQDHGIGVAQSQIKKIFKRFYRVTDKDEQTFPGLGIGLYICHEIIKRHGGKIEVQSTIGKGSVFSFSVPLYKKP